MKKYITAACLLLVMLHAEAQQLSTNIIIMDISVDGQNLEVSNPVEVTNRKGYDNQPYFSPDGQYLLFSSDRNGDQMDVFKYDISSGETNAITSTSESEYSPMIMENPQYYSVLQVDKDSIQSVWRYSFESEKKKRMTSNVDNAGYYAWIDKNHIALFLTTDTPSLSVQHIKKGPIHPNISKVGRSLHKIPGQKAISFVHKVNNREWFVKKMDINSGEVSNIVRTLGLNEDYTWSSEGYMLCGSGDHLYQFVPGKDRNWRNVADMESLNIASFYRLAISPDGRKLVVVVYYGDKP